MDHLRLSQGQSVMLQATGNQITNVIHAIRARVTAPACRVLVTIRGFRRTRKCLKTARWSLPRKFGPESWPSAQKCVSIIKQATLPLMIDPLVQASQTKVRQAHAMWQLYIARRCPEMYLLAHKRWINWAREFEWPKTSVATHACTSGWPDEGYQENSLQSHHLMPRSVFLLLNKLHCYWRVTQCKYLKLKGDRCTPCRSCALRDTIPRFIYSPANDELIKRENSNDQKHGSWSDKVVVEEYFRKEAPVRIVSSFGFLQCWFRYVSCTHLIWSMSYSCSWWDFTHDSDYGIWR